MKHANAECPKHDLTKVGEGHFTCRLTKDTVVLFIMGDYHKPLAPARIGKDEPVYGIAAIQCRSWEQAHVLAESFSDLSAHMRREAEKPAEVEEHP
jgi:hypothetical protein